MSAQEDMIERVAVVIMYGVSVRMTAAEIARDAILAMRVPTEAMVNAGAVADADGNLAADARNTWQAMIDAALPSSPGVKEG